MAFEVINDDNIPVLQVIYKDAYHISVNGLLHTSAGLVAINYDGALELNPTLPYLYISKKIVVNSVWNIVFPLSKYTIRG